MQILNAIEKTIMKISIFNSRYKTVEERPQLKLAMLPTITLLLLLYSWDFSFISLVAFILLLLSSYYEWRLFFRLKNNPYANPYE